MNANKHIKAGDFFETDLGFAFIQGARVTWGNPATSPEAGELGTVVEVYPADMRIRWDNGHVTHEEKNSPVRPAGAHQG